MDLKTALFAIARQVSDSDLDEINKLEEKASRDVNTWHSDQKGFKGMYVKLHKGWLFQLVLVFIVPVVTAYFISFKNKIMTRSTEQDTFDDGEEFEDDDERELYEELRKKYNA
jgi:hypothetical protein